MINRAFIEKTDKDLIEQDISLHARPFHVALEWIKVNRISGDIFSAELWDPLMENYKQLYPSGDFSMPSLLVGCVGLRDQAYLAEVNIGYGIGTIDPIKCIDIPQSELEVIWNQDPRQVWRAIYSVSDMWDFSYGIDDLREQSQDADQLWSNARSALTSTARTLAGGQDLASSVQSSCLAAELAMKGSLAFLGWTKPRRRKLNHHLSKLAEAIISCSSLPSDESLMNACNAFPDYINTRYEAHDLTRVQLIELGMRSQYVAAEALRRVSDRNFAGELEAAHESPTREEMGLIN